jgi:hypothetical protein
MQHGHDMSSLITTLFGQDFSILQGLKVNKFFFMQGKFSQIRSLMREDS